MTTEVISGYGSGPGETCDGLWELLSAYADGLTSPAEAARVERHVGACADCARDLAFMRETAQLLARMPEMEPPPGLRNAILAATIHRPSWQQRLRDAARRLVPDINMPALALAGSAAALLLVAYVSVEALKQPPSAPPAQIARIPRSVLPPPSYVLPSHTQSSQPVSGLLAKPSHTAAPQTKTPVLASRLKTDDTAASGMDLAASRKAKPERAAKAPIELASLGVPAARPSARAHGAAAHRIAPREVAGPHRSALAARPDRAPALDDFSPKLRPERDFTPSDMAVASADMMTTTPMDPMSPMADPMNPSRTASAPAAGTTAPPHVVLAVAPAPPSTGTGVTLADLRRRLRRQSEASLGAHQELHLRNRRELLDVLKSSF